MLLFLFQKISLFLSWFALSTPYCYSSHFLSPPAALLHQGQVQSFIFFSLSMAAKVPWVYESYLVIQAQFQPERPNVSRIRKMPLEWRLYRLSAFWLRSSVEWQLSQQMHQKEAFCLFVCLFVLLWFFCVCFFCLFSSLLSLFQYRVNWDQLFNW